MAWMIIGAIVLAGIGVGIWANQRSRTFDYRGRRYTRHGDGGFTYADAGPIHDDNERQAVQDYWDSTHDSSSSDGGSDGGGGDGGGGGD